MSVDRAGRPGRPVGRVGRSSRIVSPFVGAVVLAMSMQGAMAVPDAMKALGIREMRPPAPAPRVTLTTLAGAPLAMKDLRGKAVLVNFFATWCVPCQWEMPLMETLYRAYKNRGFEIVAISLDQGDPEGVRAFVQEKKLTYPVALDPRHEAARQFAITGLPATFLIDPRGRITGVTYGPKEWDGKHGRALVESLLPPERSVR
jgi:peroxiredoxin